MTKKGHLKFALHLDVIDTALRVLLQLEPALELQLRVEPWLEPELPDALGSVRVLCPPDLRDGRLDDAPPAVEDAAAPQRVRVRRELEAGGLALAVGVELHPKLVSLALDGGCRSCGAAAAPQDGARRGAAVADQDVVLGAVGGGLQGEAGERKLGKDSYIKNVFFRISYVRYNLASCTAL